MNVVNAMQSAGDWNNSDTIVSNDTTNGNVVVDVIPDGQSGRCSAAGRASLNGRTPTGKQMSAEDKSRDEPKCESTAKKSSNRNAINFMGNILCSMFSD